MLVLHAVDVHGPARWRWLLTDESAEPLADHQVNLDQDGPEYLAFVDLYRQLEWQAATGDRRAAEAELVDRVGSWAGEQMIGAGIAAALVAHRPVTVQVRVPAGADFLLSYPLELAQAEGLPLAEHGVTLVFEVAEPAAPVPKRPVGTRLRMLALFSMPTDQSLLALRRERHELARLIRRIGATSGAAVELQVLQYGVTRERLKDAAEDGDGWDILHVSGHGEAGQILLEHADGTADPVPTAELVALLRPARHKLKLAVLAACDSGAATAAETLNWLGLSEPAGPVRQQALDERARYGPAAVAATVGLARGLVTGLELAVLSMRYPVDDEFAIALTDHFYRRLLDRRQPVDTAVGQAVPEAAGRPNLAMGTPALFGPAAGLRLVPPPGVVELDPRAQKLAGFPPEPERFVGRTRVMVAASAALAPRSGRAGVLLHGRPGVGKTACALELAYQHRDRFEALAWWSAPPDADFATALAALAEALQAQWGVEFGDALNGPAQLRRFLPRLTALLRERGLLLVLDNLQPLLTADGHWRDPRWGQLLAALTVHSGLSKVVLTTQVVPVDSGQLLVEPVGPLSMAESAVLARELPGLRALLHVDPGPPHTGRLDVDSCRASVRRTLQVALGHPRVLQLADVAAVDQQGLQAWLADQPIADEPEDTSGSSPTDPVGHRIDELAAVIAEVEAVEGLARRRYDHVAARVTGAKKPAAGAPALQLRLAVLTAVHQAGHRRGLDAAFDACARVAEHAREQAEQTCTRLQALLDERDELRGLLGAAKAMVVDHGRGEDVELARRYRIAHDLLYHGHCDLSVAGQAVQGYLEAFRDSQAGRSSW